MVRSRSSVPPISGTAIAVITTQSEVETMMSIKAAPRVSPTRGGRDAGRRSVTGRLVGLRRWNDDERLELEEALFADAFHVHQLLDALEAAGLGPVLDNPLGRLPANAGQRFE